MPTRIKKRNRTKSSRLRSRLGEYKSFDSTLFDRIGAILVLLVALSHLHNYVQEYEAKYLTPLQHKLVELHVRAGELENKQAEIILNHVQDIRGEKKAIEAQLKKEEIALKNKEALASLNEYERALIQKESSFRVTAKNPKSTAFGLWQGLQSTREKYASKFGFDPNTVSEHEQLTMFRSYVADRYQTPEQALNHHLSRGWY